MLISEDLPTLERPINANSCLISSGHFLTSVLLIIKRALFTIIKVGSDFGSKLALYNRKSKPTCNSADFADALWMPYGFDAHGKFANFAA